MKKYQEVYVEVVLHEDEDPIRCSNETEQLPWNGFGS